MQELEKIYGDAFYAGQMTGSYESARVYANIISTLFLPSSVVDVGCGRGTWLKAFREIGTQRLLGLDGSWNSRENIVDDAIDFSVKDLNQPIELPDGPRFDLAMSLEVAEHLDPSSAAVFVESLTRLSDVVMFGAAFTSQGGKNHINEQLHSYWAKLFISYEYIPYDMFRPIVWGDDRIDYWYRQNTFLYVKGDSDAGTLIKSRGYSPMQDISFMDCVHPEQFFSYVRMVKQPTFKQGYKAFFRSMFSG